MNPLEEFLHLKEEITKEAGWASNLWSAFKGGLSQQPTPAGAPPPVGEALARGAGMIGLPMLLGTGAALAAHGISGGIGAIRERFGKARDFKAMLSQHPQLQKEDAGHVQSLYNSLRTMSPTMAKDPLLAGSFVRNQLRMSTEEGPMVGPDTAKMLAETERGVVQSRPGHPILDTLRYAPMAGMAPGQAPQSTFETRFPLEEGGYAGYKEQMSPEKARGLQRRAEQEFAIRQMNRGTGESQDWER